MKPPIQPALWIPPAPTRSKLAKLRTPLRTIPLPARGEDVAIDAQGRLICGLVDGRVVRLDERGTLEELGNTGGRPLGIEVDGDSAVVCDAKRGLLRLDLKSRALEVLVDARTQGLGFCNNAAVARDGTIYFSDSSRQVGIDHWRGELLAHSATGRLLKLTKDGKLTVLIEGLEFANGVALAQDESFVAVAETTAYRVRKLWLKGPLAGSQDALIDDLPGFPDNLSSDAEGRLWIAIANPRNPLLDFLLPKPAVLRQVVWALPERIQPGPERSIRVLAVDRDGRVVREISGKTSAYHMVTGMRVHGQTLYLASLEEAALATISLATT
ncbi:MAG TPA: SMP-30/gluconolactonase/LRE family protein [Polyangiales bacterium]|nr:SMP-30/gluconolactonase/LRE family protein [Polyangiales bacterium]